MRSIHDVSVSFQWDSQDPAEELQRTCWCWKWSSGSFSCSGSTKFTMSSSYMCLRKLIFNTDYKGQDEIEIWINLQATSGVWMFCAAINCMKICIRMSQWGSGNLIRDVTLNYFLSFSLLWPSYGHFLVLSWLTYWVINTYQCWGSEGFFIQLYWWFVLLWLSGTVIHVLVEVSKMIVNLSLCSIICIINPVLSLQDP